MQIQVDTYQVEIPLPDLDTSKHREQFGLSTTNPLIRRPPRSFSPQQRRPPHSSLGVPSFPFHVVDGDVVAKSFVLKWVSFIPKSKITGNGKKNGYARKMGFSGEGRGINGVWGESLCMSGVGWVYIGGVVWIGGWSITINQRRAARSG